MGIPAQMQGKVTPKSEGLPSFLETKSPTSFLATHFHTDIQAWDAKPHHVLAVKPTFCVMFQVWPVKTPIVGCLNPDKPKFCCSAPISTIVNQGFC